MGAACQKSNEQQVTSSIHQDFDYFEKIENEIHPKKIHSGLRKLQFKTSNQKKNENSVCTQLLQNEDLAICEKNSKVIKSTHDQSLQKEKLLNSQQLFDNAISTQQHSSKLIKSSLKTILNYSSKNYMKKFKKRDNSEKQVRFKLPKNLVRKRRAQSQTPSIIPIVKHHFIVL